MNPMTIYRYAELVAISILSATISMTSTFASEPNMDKPMWQTSSCIKTSLSVQDKFNTRTSHRIVYLVKSENENQFSAERETNGSSESFRNAAVTFPNDFILKIKNDQRISAFVDCVNGKNYQWSIAIDGKVIDQGTFSFHREIINK